MPHITSYSDAKTTRRQREIPGGHHSWRTDFMKPPAGVDEAPTAFLSESTPGRVIRTHYHALDQFHIIVIGGGTLGKHDLGHYVVHFARAYTPYGPMVASENGLGFISLYPRRDSGAHYLPECVEELMATEERKPWQISEMPEFHGTNENYEHKFSRMHNDEGLAAYSIGLKPHAETTAPDASMTDGQFILVTKGSLLFESRVYEPLSLIFVKPDEPRFRMTAGAEGVEALAVHFPRQEKKPAAAKPVADAQAGYRVWQCALCAFVYDEAVGMPDEGIAAGTRWEDVPDDWTCPDCAASKADFQMFVRD